MSASPYERAYEFVRAYEDEAWGRASAGHWGRLDAIAAELQRGEYGWEHAVLLLNDTLEDMKDADAKGVHSPSDSV